MKVGKIKFNWPLVGNGQIIEYLAKSISNNNIAGSYIFTGPDNLGKTTVANYFARSLVCTGKDLGILPCGKCPACEQAEKGIYGDITVIKKDKDKKNISIGQIREFIRSLSLSSFLNSYKIGIIKHAETLSHEAFNALLKTLEEPNSKVMIILITADLEILPKTIISRSQVLRFKPVKSDIIYDFLVKEFKASRSAAKNFSRLAIGRPALAVKFFEDKEFYENYKNRAKAFIDFTNGDINQRLTKISEIIGSEAAGQESVRQGLRIIEIWQGLVRDLLLLNFNQGDIIQHHFLENELNSVKGKFSLNALFDLANSLKQAKEYITANVNPKTVLENIAVNVV